MKLKELFFSRVCPHAVRGHADKQSHVTLSHMTKLRPDLQIRSEDQWSCSSRARNELIVSLLF